MKRYIIVLSFLFGTIALFSQEEKDFTINGKFPTSYYDGLKVYLNEIDYRNTNGMIKKDSAVVNGERFVFSGMLDKPISLGYITLVGNE